LFYERFWAVGVSGQYALGIEEGALEGHMTRGLRSLAESVLSDSTSEKQGAHITGAQQRAR
jgi:hypothetical protein